MPVRPLSDRLARQGCGDSWTRQYHAVGCRNYVALAENDEEHAAITATLVDALQYSTMDAELLAMLADGHRLVVTLEDGQLEADGVRKSPHFMPIPVIPRLLTFVC